MKLKSQSSIAHYYKSLDSKFNFFLKESVVNPIIDLWNTKWPIVGDECHSSKVVYFEEEFGSMIFKEQGIVVA